MELIGLFVLFFGIDLAWGKSLSGFNGVEMSFDNEDSGDYYDEIRDGDARILNWLFIFPGTKWCGNGNRAQDYDDLGDFVETDKCCRDHDQCDDYIEGYKMGHNLTNPSFYTRLSCDCDAKFYNCLRSVDTVQSNAVGRIYFNLLGTQCFKYEHTSSSCSKYAYIPRKKCILYSIDMKSQKLYQWFDLPIF